MNTNARPWHADPTEDEPDPDPVGGGGMNTNARPWHADPTEDEPDPDPVGGGGHQPSDEESLASAHFARSSLTSLCRRSSTAQKAAIAVCSPSLAPGQARRESLGAEPEESFDWYQLVITEWTTVAIETKSEIDTVGRLYSPLGYPLLLDDDSGDDTNFRLIEKLAPGTYFVRVEARHRQSGVYQLNVNEIDQF